MTKIVIFILFFIPITTIAEFKNNDLIDHLNKYFMGFRNKDLSQIRKVVSKNYYQKLIKNKHITNSFKYPNSDKKIEKIDYKIKKANGQSNKFFITTKRKSEKDFSEVWYVLEIKDSKIKIIDTRLIED